MKRKLNMVVYDGVDFYWMKKPKGKGKGKGKSNIGK